MRLPSPKGPDEAKLRAVPPLPRSATPAPASTRTDHTPAADAAAPGPETRCIACGELITWRVDARPEHCFLCAVHVVCACADDG